MWCNSRNVDCLRSYIIRIFDIKSPRNFTKSIFWAQIQICDAVWSEASNRHVTPLQSHLVWKHCRYMWPHGELCTRYVEFGHISSVFWTHNLRLAKLCNTQCYIQGLTRARIVEMWRNSLNVDCLRPSSAYWIENQHKTWRKSIFWAQIQICDAVWSETSIRHVTPLKSDLIWCTRPHSGRKKARTSRNERCRWAYIIDILNT